MLSRLLYHSLRPGLWKVDARDVLPNILADGDTSFNLGSIIMSGPTEVVPTNSPSLAHPADQNRLLHHTEKEGQSFPSPHLMILNDALVDGAQGLVWLKDRRLLSQSLFFEREIKQTQATAFKAGAIVPRANDSAPESLSKAMIIHSHWAQNYFHWLIDFLPRLALMQDYGDIPLILPAPAPKFIAASLDRVGIITERRLDPSPFVQKIERLYLPCQNNFEGWRTPHSLNWLRAAILKTEPPLGKRRLYVSRGDAPTRRVTNDVELMQALRAFGFERIAPGELTFEQQVDSFAQAEIVVGAHGAGLANLLFAPRQTRLIELFPESDIVWCYYTLASVLGMPYGMSFGKSHGFKKNYKVNVDHVVSLVKRALNHR